MFGFRQKQLLNNCNKLNFGCGTNLLDGFLNIDLIKRKGVYVHNVINRFPLNDDNIEAIYTEHMIEHLKFEQVIFFLKDCYRLLKNDSPIRIATPNLKSFIDFYLGKNEDELKAYTEFIAKRKTEIPIKLLSQVFFLNEIMSNHGHRCVFDFNYLQQVLEYIGFKDIQKSEVNKSAIPYFNNIEGHGKVIGDRINNIETLVIEAWKR